MRAAEVGNLQQGVTCEDKHFIPKPAAFLNEVHPPRDQLPPISTCVRRFDMVDDLTHDLFEQHARPQVHWSFTCRRSARLSHRRGGGHPARHTDCSKDFVRAFILSVRAMAPSEQL